MDISEVKKVWEDAKRELQNTVPDYAFNTWFSSLEATGYDNNIFSLLTVHQMAVEIIRKNHYTQVKSALENILGHQTDFTVTYDSQLAEKYKKEKQKEEKKKIPNNTDEDNKELAKENLARMQSFSNLNLKYRFDNFVVGENNMFAHTAALSVAQNPAKRYNPLFIYGASGLGKTHLLHAIGHHIIFNKPKLKVRYITTESFTNEIVSILQKRNFNNKDKNYTMEKFHQKYRNLDVFLIDDIQFLESKQFTTIEMFNTFEELYHNNKQIVIASDRQPKDIPTLPDRLRTRFEMGLVVDITPPDFETRVAILKNKAEQSGFNINFDVCEYIANNYTNNIRELEGAYNRVCAYSDMQKLPITLDLAKKVLRCDENKKALSIDNVMNAVADYYDVTINDFKSAARNQKVSNARHIAVYITREKLNKSYESIAEYLNKKHPTILYSYDKIKNELKTNKELEQEIIQIQQKIRN